MYISAFQMLFRGLFRRVGLEPLANIAIQGWIYLLPLFLLCVPSKLPVVRSKLTYFLITIQFIYLFGVIFPITMENGGAGLFFLGLKNYYLPLLYFPIFFYLLQYRRKFEVLFFKHILLIGIIYAAYFLMELVYLNLVSWRSSQFRWLIDSINYNLAFQGDSYILYNRPTGIYGTMQVNGLFFAVLAVLCRSIKLRVLGLIPSKALFYFFTLCLVFSTAKTYTIAFFLFITASVLFHPSSKNNIKLIILGAIALIGLVIFNSSILSYYEGIFTPGTGSRTVPRMIEKFLELEFFLQESILPNGFMPESGAEEIVGISKVYQDSEIYLYKLVYQIGILGGILWVITMFRPLFRVNLRKVFKNNYIGILFVSFLGFSHYFVMHTPFLFFIAILCNILALHTRSVKFTAPSRK